MASSECALPVAAIFLVTFVYGVVCNLDSLALRVLGIITGSVIDKDILRLLWLNVQHLWTAPLQLLLTKSEKVDQQLNSGD